MRLGALAGSVPVLALVADSTRVVKHARITEDCMAHTKQLLDCWYASASAAAVIALSLIPARDLRGQPSRTSDSAMELGIDLGVARATHSSRSQSMAVPVALRIGWLDDDRRANLEFQVILNDRREGSQRTSNTMSTFHIGIRLKKDSIGGVPFSGPYVSIGGGVTSLRRYLTTPDVPRYRFLPSAVVGVGTRRALGNSLLRFETVAAFDRGYAGPESTLFVPSRVSLGLRFGFSALHRR